MMRCVGPYIDDREDGARAERNSPKKALLVTAVVAIGVVYAVAGSLPTSSPDLANFPSAQVAKAERVVLPQVASLEVVRQ
ncbi:hypothetical protein [Rhizobium sp. RU36D]|uniref:hypothetical protein n=1 Tax=Rhizobium sp. RU36D TaxID=1907415 RepID=UPI0009D896F4|nr:hypothetical protein [Rhizobium sp. RU36D]SMC57145.1 hypothetical protein SAMN05880593_10334 [Rhizobium sp. RU36D]